MLSFQLRYFDSEFAKRDDLLWPAFPDLALCNDRELKPFVPPTSDRTFVGANFIRDASPTVVTVSEFEGYLLLWRVKLFDKGLPEAWDILESDPSCYLAQAVLKVLERVNNVRQSGFLFVWHGHHSKVR